MNLDKFIRLHYFNDIKKTNNTEVIIINTDYIISFSSVVLPDRDAKACIITTQKTYYTSESIDEIITLLGDRTEVEFVVEKKEEKVKQSTRRT